MIIIKLKIAPNIPGILSKFMSIIDVNATIADLGKLSYTGHRN